MGTGGAAGAGVAKPPCLANPSNGVIIGDPDITGLFRRRFSPPWGRFTRRQTSSVITPWQAL